MDKRVEENIKEYFSKIPFWNPFFNNLIFKKKKKTKRVSVGLLNLEDEEDSDEESGSDEGQTGKR